MLNSNRILTRSSTLSTLVKRFKFKYSFTLIFMTFLLMESLCCLWYITASHTKSHSFLMKLKDRNKNTKYQWISVCNLWVLVSLCSWRASMYDWISVHTKINHFPFMIALKIYFRTQNRKKKNVEQIYKISEEAQK